MSDTRHYYGGITDIGTPYNRYWNKVKEILEQAIANTGINHRRYWNLSHYRLQITVCDFRFQISVSDL